MCDLCHIYVAVGRSDKTEVFLADALAGRSELGDSAHRSSLRRLAACVGVHFGVDNYHVYILAGSEHVVETAEADIVCSAVAGDNPLRTGDDEALELDYGLAGIATASLAEEQACCTPRG